ncbi:HSPB1-associated protein 1 isoform X2 [Leptopilina boulardi]|uniref:HSPB1-associated protein 1 isoform X2 n=1 Tax=Leptopilina boulardi TaxID=63433 RepID=UPI0021F68A4C|nr:HSPB1-associated protein 1 isoform X2 [Leptopilina boulardi]
MIMQIIIDCNSKIKKFKENDVSVVNLDLDVTSVTNNIESEFSAEEVIAEPSVETLRNAIKDLEEPVLFRNLLRKCNGENVWDILKWDMETLSEKIGEKILPFRSGYKARTTKPQWEVKNRVEWMTMKAFMNKKDSCNWYYFDYKYMHDWCKDCPEILNSLSWNTFGFNLSGEDSTIWIGNEGAHTNCHQDSYGCNLVAQIHGQKEWILFPPEATENLRPRRVPYEESTVYSSINLYSPSLEEENQIKNISGVRIVTLQPGEVLFIPKGWWHYVESLNLSVSINVWLPLETDCKARLEESLVKLMINEIGTNIPTTSETEKCSIFESISFIRRSLEECNKQKIKKVSARSNDQAVWTTTTLTNAYSSFVFLVRHLNSTELQHCLSLKRNRFSTCIDNANDYSIKQNELGLSNQLLFEKIVNAFCNPEAIKKVADTLLNEDSFS